MTTSTATMTRPSTGRLFLALGLGLAILGVAGYVVQIALRHLWVPWYMPCLAI